MYDRWVEPMVADWVKGVEAMARVARKYPQSSYVGFTQSLQAECRYICRCVAYVGQHLGLLEVDIRGKLIPALLDLPPEEVTDE